MGKKRAPSAPKAKTSLYLAADLYKAFRIAAIEEGMPVTRLIERLIDEYLASRKTAKR